MSQPDREHPYPRSAAAAQRASALIPAGGHTYSKGPDQFPERAPGVIGRAKGAHCWDLDGNEFVDWGMGLRSVILGHAHPPVLDAVREWLELGSNFTRPSPIEAELAAELVDLIPCAEMVKFAKNGSDVTSAAVRLARAFTGRDCIARCRDNPFFSFYDWFIGSTPANAGIPARVSELTLMFDYNDPDSLERLFQAHPGEIACVILEPAMTVPPAPGFLEQVRAITRAHGAVLIFDEIITGFRWHEAGAQTYFGVTPDLATFGKAMANGFSVSALVGRRDIMRLGGLDHDQPRVFLLSATNGAETHSLAAALVTIRELRARGMSYVWDIGRRLQEGFNARAAAAGLAGVVSMEGFPCSPYIIARGRDAQPSMEYRTLLLQETIAAGILMPWIAPSFAHTVADVEATVAAADRAFARYRTALEGDNPMAFVQGPAVKPVFRRFN